MRILALFAFLITSCMTAEAIATIAPYTSEPIKTASPAEYTIEVPTFTATVSPTPKFAETVSEDDILTRVYIPTILALPVKQQPYPAFVTEEDDEFTQFSLASDYGSTGLLAHNYLAGRHLPEITIGEEIYLVYESGIIHKYTVIEVLQFQTVNPYSVYSDFIPTTGDRLTVEELFELIYNRPGFLILQTSIATEESGAWGRLFVIAERNYG